MSTIKAKPFQTHQFLRGVLRPPLRTVSRTRKLPLNYRAPENPYKLSGRKHQTAATENMKLVCLELISPAQPGDHSSFACGNALATVAVHRPARQLLY